MGVPSMEAEKKIAEEALSKFSSTLDEVEASLRPMLAAVDGLRATTSEAELDAMSRARTHITLSYAASSLFVMYLRTQGMDPLEHPVVDEITRIQEAFMRMRKVEAGLSAGYQKPPDRDRRRHIQNVQKSEAKLSSLLFPEERDLVNVLYGKEKRPRASTTVEEERDADRESDSDVDDDGLGHIKATEKEAEEMRQDAEKKDRREAQKKERKEKKLEKQLRKSSGISKAEKTKKKHKKRGKKKNKE